MADRVGQQLGNYRLVSLIGQGSFADVYLGEHLHLGTQAAIKVLAARLVSEQNQSFLHEARTIAHLEHPHIVRVLDYGVESELPYLVMQYAPGGTLRQLYPRGAQLPLATVVSYVKQLASALQYAHDANVIHRDIKPENMLLGRSHEVLLSDFGLATLAHSTLSQHTQPEQNTAGTLTYMSPEQLNAHPTRASDQYALGIVVYEWLSGAPPFSGSFPEIALKHTLGAPPSLCEKISTLPSGVEHVVMQALAKDPNMRFSSVLAFATALERASLADLSGHIGSIPSQDHLTVPEHNSALSHVRKHNLPAQLTPLLGREQEVLAICTRLRRSEVRLLTLTGPGGIGKTRLGLEVATCLLDDFVDGVFFIPLATISDPSLVITTFALGLGLKDHGDHSVIDMLKAFLRDKHLLLFLDNFEQVLTAAPSLSDLLTTCSHLKILVTSRAVLHIQGEYEFPVPSLALPDLNHLPSTDTLSRCAAVALFLQRAEAAKPIFQMTDTNAHTIAEICVHLDGLPLAIELAAARIKLLSLQALLARLKHRLQVLTSGTQEVPVRQQTLRNTIAWSYNLLSDHEQRLFRQISVFVGGCTLEAVEAICSTLNPEDEVGQVLDDVVSLIDKSLLQSIERENEESRLQMLETIREFGLECLSEGEEMIAARQEHALYYVVLAEEAESRLNSAEQRRWLDQLEREHENLRAALTWLIERARSEKTDESIEIGLALRLGSALWQFWWMRGYAREGRDILEQVLRASQGVTVFVRARVLNAAGVLAGMQGDFERAEALCAQSLALFKNLGGSRDRATSLNILVYMAVMRSDYAAARELEEETLGLFREVGNTSKITFVLVDLAYVLLFQGDYARAQLLLEESLVLWRKEGDTWGIAYALWHLGPVIFFQGEYARAQTLLEEALALSREGGYKGIIAYALQMLGLLAIMQGHVLMARLQLEESLMLFKEVEDWNGIAQSLGALGWASFSQGDYITAQTLMEESFGIVKARGNKWLIAICLAGLGIVVAMQRKRVWSTRLFGATEALCEAIGALLPPFIRDLQALTITTARTQLGEEAFAATWAEGRTLTPEQVLTLQEQALIPTAIPATVPSSPPVKSKVTYPDELTAREVDVLRLVARGLSNMQVADQLVISPRTVDKHLTSIYSKIGVTSRSAATRYAMEHPLL